MSNKLPVIPILLIWGNMLYLPRRIPQDLVENLVYLCFKKGEGWRVGGMGKRKFEVSTGLVALKSWEEVEGMVN